MSDFLTSLALRTLKPEESVQPRLRTRFEPTRASLELSTPLATQEVQTEPAMRNELTPHSPGTEQQIETPPRRGHRRRTTQQTQNERDEPETQAPHPTIRAHETHRRRHESQAASFQETIRQDTRVSSPSAPVPKPETRVLPKPGPVLEPAPRPVALPKAIQDVSAPGEMNHKPDTVHISIGRVEVRALLQSNPRPSRPASKPTLMTLDEYLTRRAKGESS